MSVISVTFQCACEYLDLRRNDEASEILDAAFCDMTYVFVESDAYNVPEDPIALIDWNSNEVDCVLTQSTWKFRSRMDDQKLLDTVADLVRSLVEPGNTV